MIPQSPSKWAPWDLTQFSQSPSAAPSYFSESHQQSEISTLAKIILVLRKSRSHRAPNLGCGRAESPEWFDVSPKNSAWDMMHEWARFHDEAANHWLPIAVGFWIIQIVSMEKCSSLMQNMMQICCSTYLLSDFKCNCHTVHMLTKQCLPPPLTSTVKLSLFTHVHSSPLSLVAGLHRYLTNRSHYITMAGFFPHRPHI